MSPAARAAQEATHRPRVEGDRELEILRATLDVLADVGYDRLTMDAVAAAAKASKATLYRRWNGKAALVVEAFCAQKEPPSPVDTGSLRGDLQAAFCGMGGLTDRRQLAILGAVITAISRDNEFAEAFRRDFVGPKVEVAVGVFRRAQQRGEISQEADLDLLASVVPALVLHRSLLLGEPATADLIERVIDHVVLPAATSG